MPLERRKRVSWVAPDTGSIGYHLTFKSRTGVDTFRKNFNI